MTRNVDPREIGRVGNLTSVDVMAALGSVTEGRVYDLDAGRFVGMPQWDGHPRFMLTSFRTPAGTRHDGDLELLDPSNNAVDFRLHTELMITGMHAGTHIDALNHAVCGSEGDTFFGNFGPESVGDFGPDRADAASIPPILVRTALLDIARLHGVERLAPGEGIDAATLRRAESEQGPIPHGGALLLRTGLMSEWSSDPASFDKSSGAGLDREAASWLAEERGVVLVGSDTPTVEQVPSRTPGHPHPVHDLYLRQLGVHLLENVWLEDVCRESVRHGLLIVLPLKVTGATGSMVRPVVVV